MSQAEQIARDYMNHYSAEGFDSMEAYMAPDMVFSDPTALGANVGDAGLHHEGSEATMVALRQLQSNRIGVHLGNGL